VQVNIGYIVQADDMFSQNLNELALTSSHLIQTCQSFFLICRSCFWCSSCIYGTYNVPNKCPMCNDCNTI